MNNNVFMKNPNSTVCSDMSSSEFARTLSSLNARIHILETHLSARPPRRPDPIATFMRLYNEHKENRTWTARVTVPGEEVRVTGHIRGHPNVHTEIRMDIKKRLTTTNTLDVSGFFIDDEGDRLEVDKEDEDPENVVIEIDMICNTPLFYDEEGSGSDVDFGFSRGTGSALRQLHPPRVSRS